MREECVDLKSMRCTAQKELVEGVLACHRHRHHCSRRHRQSLEFGDYFGPTSITHRIITAMDHDVK